MTKLEELEVRIKKIEDRFKKEDKAKRLATYKYCMNCCKNKPPKGFKSVQVGPCGLTDYYRQEDWCASCVKKYDK